MMKSFRELQTGFGVFKTWPSRHCAIQYELMLCEQPKKDSHLLWSGH